MMISDAQVAEINTGKEKLMQSAQKLFAKVYEQSGAAAGAQGAGPNPGAGSQVQSRGTGSGRI